MAIGSDKGIHVATWRNRNVGEGGTIRLFRVPREAIDEGSDDPDAYDIIWVDDSGIRRAEIRIDPAAQRLRLCLDEWDFRRLAGWIYGAAPKKINRLLEDMIRTDAEAWNDYEPYAVQLV